MKRLSKKQIIIIISVAIAIIALAIAGIVLGINNGKKKETVKSDDKIESVETDETDREENEEKTDETVVVEDESKGENTTEETTEVEETKQQTSSNTNQNSSTSTNTNANTNTNTGNNSGSSTGNNGGNTTATPSTSTTEPTTEPSPYAGMYTILDDASKERLAQCAKILNGGMASSVVPIVYHHNFVEYWNGKIMVSAGNTSGAWMYVLLNCWYADTTNVGSDETRPGYAEIPSLVKPCLEAIAPEGGTELYNKISALVSQYGADYHVPTQGTISESIPGLYVTLTQGKSGLEIRFFAE